MAIKGLVGLVGQGLDAPGGPRARAIREVPHRDSREKLFRMFS